MAVSESDCSICMLKRPELTSPLLRLHGGSAEVTHNACRACIVIWKDKATVAGRPFACPFCRVTLGAIESMSEVKASPLEKLAEELAAVKKMLEKERALRFKAEETAARALSERDQERARRKEAERNLSVALMQLESRDEGSDRAVMTAAIKAALLDTETAAGRSGLSLTQIAVPSGASSSLFPFPEAAVIAGGQTNEGVAPPRAAA
jgi:hypothetical protein